MTFGIYRADVAFHTLITPLFDWEKAGWSRKLNSKPSFWWQWPEEDSFFFSLFSHSFLSKDFSTITIDAKVIYWALHAKIANKYFYLNSCSLTTSPRYSMINCPAFSGSLVRIPHPFSSARNLSRHCTHSCLCIRWLQHCSPQGQVFGEHSAKIILK